VLLALLLAGSMVALWFALTRITRSTLEQDERVALEGVASLTAPLVIGLADDPAELSMGLRQAQVAAGLDMLQVLNSIGETVSPLGGMPASSLVGSARLEELLRQAPVTLLQDGVRGRQFLHIRPLDGGGYVAAVRGAQMFELRLADMNRLVLLWSGVLLLVSWLLAALIVRRVVTRPIEKLIEQAASMATGVTSDLALGEDSEEYGMLRKSMRDMARRISQDRDRIRRHADELQRMNVELGMAQEQLIRTEKLAAVGQLAAGMAHEIGNPVGIILGYTEILENPSLSEAKRTQVLGQIRKAIDRIDITIKDILNYSRPAEDEDSDANPEAEVSSVLDLLAPQKRFRSVETRVTNTLERGTSVSLPPSRLKQVLLNLFLNAADAMNGDGLLEIGLGELKGMVVIAVTDSGPGISEELAYRIFDPFFTTKEPGKGTGLGLFVCQTVVNHYGGSISVEGRPGKGARFTLSLPSGGKQRS